MADSDYTHGEMDISSQAGAWDGFMKTSLWGGLITILLVAYLTFTLAMGMNWLVSLGLCVVGGVVIGLAMGMGGAWMATVIGLTALALLVQLLITVFGMVL